MSEVRRDGVWRIRSFEDDTLPEDRRLAECPLCGHEFAVQEHRWKHFLTEHGPEDVGLEPLSHDHDGQSSLSSYGGEQA